MKKEFLKIIFYNLSLIVVPAYFIRFVIWFITLSIDAGPGMLWKNSSLSMAYKLLIPNIFAQNGLLSGLSVTFFITISAWVVCIMLSAIFSFFSYSYSYLRAPVKGILWMSNFHLFFGFLLLFFIWGEDINPDWFWASLIIIFCNGSLQSMTNKFIDQMDEIFNKKYVLFSISQGINKWHAGYNELIIKMIYSALEMLPFFLLSTIIIELVFERLKGLGSILLDNIKDIINNGL